MATRVAECREISLPCVELRRRWYRRMPGHMRELFQQRLEHLYKMGETHIEIEVTGEYCLVFRDPSLAPENEICQYCSNETYLALPRKGAQWLAAGNSKRDRAEEKQSPIDHLTTPYAHVSGLTRCLFG